MSECIDLIDAIYQGTIDDVKFFVEEQGADVNADCGGNPPLIWLVFGGRSDVEKLRYLVAQGADVNAKKDDSTVLHYYVYKENAEVEFLECLLSFGADVNAKNDNGNTPLHYCVVGEKVNMEMLKCLVLHGADVNAKDVGGNTPLDRARDKPEVVEFLGSLGAESGAKPMETVEGKCQNCGSPLVIEPGQDRVMCPYCRSQNLITVGTDGSIIMSLVQKVDSIDNKADQLLNTQNEALAQAQHLHKVVIAEHTLAATKDEYESFIKNEYQPHYGREYSPRSSKVEQKLDQLKKEYKEIGDDGEEKANAIICGCAIMAIPGIIVAFNALGNILGLMAQSGGSVFGAFWLPVIFFAILVGVIVIARYRFLWNREADRMSIREKMDTVNKEWQEWTEEFRKNDPVCQKKTGFEKKIADLEGVILGH